MPDHGFAIEIEASDINLSLNGHTIIAPQGSGIGITFFPGTSTSSSNVRVTNGAIVAAGQGIEIFGSYCTLNRLTITVGQSGYGINIEHGEFNRVANCVLIGGQPTPSQGNVAQADFALFLASNNAIEDCTLEGAFLLTISEQDLILRGPIVLGNNTFRGNHFANPTQ